MFKFMANAFVCFRDGSWFKNIKLTLKECVYLLYYWSTETPQKIISRELVILKNSVVDWMNFISNLVFFRPVNYYCYLRALNFIREVIRYEHLIKEIVNIKCMFFQLYG